jgi:hypothetical protein
VPRLYGVMAENAIVYPASGTAAHVWGNGKLMN